ncbi:MAG: hypothetical protein WBF17_15030 [Phycisphaerae bacterium]
MKARISRLSWLVVALLACGCEIHPVTPPPSSLTEYEESKAGSKHPYPDRTVVLHNLKRVLDPQLGQTERLESLRLVSRIGEDDPEVQDQLAGLLADENCSEAMRAEVLALVIEKDHPDAPGHVLKVLPTLRPEDPLKQRVLEWLARHPAPQVLAGLAKLWAREQSPTSLDEPRYRQVVERLTGQRWDQALLDGIDTEGFGARGSAIAILSARRSRDEIARAVAALPAKTDAVAAMQFFLDRFDYLPTSGPTLLSCVWLYAKDPSGFDGAARLAADWRQSYGYRFDVRDFHLLSRLARDPLRKNYERTELVLRLVRGLIKREHVRMAVTRPVGRYGFSDQFSKHVDSLTMADLWNLLLLDEMMSRPRVRAALAEVARRNQADPGSARCGVVFYVEGQGEAKLYPPAYESDRIRAGRNALCRFGAHFEKPDNADRAGPTAEELQIAGRDNAYGLVLTSLAEETFCAHYHNPKGIVISLGRFSFK